MNSYKGEVFEARRCGRILLLFTCLLSNLFARQAGAYLISSMGSCVGGSDMIP
jgi:hypothetical protein